MKRNRNRLISFLTLAAMLVSMFTVAASASADASTVKIDFSTRDTFEANAYVTRHIPTQFRPDPYTPGVYEFSEANNAVRLDYRATANEAPYRLMFGFDSASYLKAENKYMVVVYAAKTTASYRMALWNSPKNGYEAVITANGTDTGGKFVVSSPVDISASSNSVKSSSDIVPTAKAVLSRVRLYA